MNQPATHRKPISHQPLFAWSMFSAVLILPLLLSSCAQLNQFMGKPAEPTETAQPVPAQEPAPQATVTTPSTESASPRSVETGSPETKPAHKAAGAPSPKASHEQTSQAAATAQPTGPDSKQTSDKAVAEKDQPKKDKKASAASDKKSTKKSSKPETKPQPEDAFLPPVPLPSKPAAIGGSGG